MSAQMDTEAELSAGLARVAYYAQRVPTRALFLAGKIYRRYRSFGGIRTGSLPDFFIGAHAQALGVPDPDPRCAAVQNVLSRRRADYAADALVGAACRQDRSRTE